MPLRTDPGQLGGDAIVNTLFGDNNPGALVTFGPVGLRRGLSEMRGTCHVGGKTPVTWYGSLLLLKNGGDHSFGGRFGPLRNRPPIL